MFHIPALQVRKEPPVGKLSRTLVPPSDRIVLYKPILEHKLSESLLSRGVLLFLSILFLFLGRQNASLSFQSDETSFNLAGRKRVEQECLSYQFCHIS